MDGRTYITNPVSSQRVQRDLLWI